MSKNKEIISKQIESNQGKNLFFEGAENSLKFTQDILKTAVNIDKIDDFEANILIDYATDKVLEEFLRVNQYYSFGSRARVQLRKIYVELFSELKSHVKSIDQVSNTHYQNLKTWLLETNSFAAKVYSQNLESIEPVPCFEYNPEMQIEILQIDVSRILEPVLDIGCGKQGSLVSYLRSKRVEAYGVDRLLTDNPNLTSADWLEFDFGKERWGTITSNLGFSNHFKHHHMREDGDFLKYATKYMEIMKSLKIGGKFHYAPYLPFIEKYLSPENYGLSSVKIKNTDFYTTITKRLK